MDRISVIVPCYNEEEVIPAFYAKLREASLALEGRAEVEVIFVDDGSTDGTLKTVSGISERDPLAGFISLSRNFGKEAAMLAGLRAAGGEFATVMDADLQDSPETLVKMYGILAEKPEVDCVAARRVTREGEPKLRSHFAKRFYCLINSLSETAIEEGARDFRLMRRQMLDSVLSLGEKCRFTKGIFSWVGYNTEWIDQENTPRAAGDTKWSFTSLVKYAIEGILAFSTAPLRLPIVLSALFFAASAVFFILAAVMVKSVLAVIGTVLISASAILASLGVIGSYLSKTYKEVKARPEYVVRKTGGSVAASADKTKKMQKI